MPCHPTIRFCDSYEIAAVPTHLDKRPPRASKGDKGSIFSIQAAEAGGSRATRANCSQEATSPRNLQASNCSNSQGAIEVVVFIGGIRCSKPCANLRIRKP